MKDAHVSGTFLCSAVEVLNRVHGLCDVNIYITNQARQPSPLSVAGKASLDACAGSVCKHLGGHFQAEAPSPALGPSDREGRATVAVCPAVPSDSIHCRTCGALVLGTCRPCWSVRGHLAGGWPTPGDTAEVLSHSWTLQKETTDEASGLAADLGGVAAWPQARVLSPAPVPHSPMAPS